MIRQASPQQKSSGFDIDPATLGKLAEHANLSMGDVERVLMGAYKEKMIQLYPWDAKSEIFDDPLPNPEMAELYHRVEHLEAQLAPKEVVTPLKSTHQPSCGKCGVRMNPRNSIKAPELFLCDECYYKSLGNETVQPPTRSAKAIGASKTIESVLEANQHLSDQVAKAEMEREVFRKENARLRETDLKVNQLYADIRNGRIPKKDGTGIIDEVHHLMTSRDEWAKRGEEQYKTIVELQTKVGNLKSENRTALAEILELRKVCDERGTRVDILVTENNRLRVQLEAMVGIRNDLEKDNASFKTCIDHLEQTIDKLRREKKQ